MPPPAITGAGARDGDCSVFLGEPLLANGGGGGGGGGGRCAGAVATVADGAEQGAKKKQSAEDKYWVDIEQPADVESGGGRRRRLLLFRNKRVKRSILYPYRFLIFARLIAIILFFIWRLKNNTADVEWLWALSVAGDVWFGFSWLLNQLPRLNPVKSIPDLAALSRQHDGGLPGGGGGGSRLPGVDTFINTANPVDEPVLCTMNSVLSILAADYPAERHACYLSDDAGALVHYEALAEAARFAALWVPFCRKHGVEPRAPERYFGFEFEAPEEAVPRPYTGGSPDDFVGDRRRVRGEYEEFRARVGMLPETIRRRSDAYNNAAMKSGADAKATWMVDGTQWPGAWIDPTENHMKGHYTPIIKVLLEQPSHTPQFGHQPAGGSSGIDLSGTDSRLPMLVYVAREKHPTSYDHQKKAGAMNVQLRVSALLSNAPFVINFDCDHYTNNSMALRAAMCFMLDPREGADTAFVQFPQRFDGVDPGDRYCNHNRVFFDGTMLALNGLQGPSYLGTGCLFRRAALYGGKPPRRDAAAGGGGIAAEASVFGGSAPFLESIRAAAGTEQDHRPAMAPPPPPPLDDEPSVTAELLRVMSCAYESGTSWGRDVGWVYNIATEDVATGFRVHRQGWLSRHCSMEPAAFRGTAPINLTERLLQILRWSGGSLEMFFSHNNPLGLGGGGGAGWRWLHPLQRVAYLNMTIYPVTSVFTVLYGLCPVTWLLPGEVYVQRPFERYVAYLALVILTIHAIGAFEVRWAGIGWADWWRNEQFFMVGATSAYPTAVLYMAAKLVTGRGIRFRITSKQQQAADASADGEGDRFADLYVFRWAPLLAPTAVVLAANVGAVGVALGKVAVFRGAWAAAQVRHAALGLLFNAWIVALLQPFALALLGRRGRTPGVLFVALAAAFAAVALAYVALHSLLGSFSIPF